MSILARLDSARIRPFSITIQKRTRRKNNRVAKDSMLVAFVDICIGAIKSNSLSIWIGIDKIIPHEKTKYH